ncbi:MAG: hypothetical protein WCL02_02970 [bacterium]
MVFEHVDGGGAAKTTQFPPRFLNGCGIALPMVYGPKHIAIPTPMVSVGATYNLNTDGYTPQGAPKKNPSVAHFCGNPKNPTNGMGTTTGNVAGISKTGIPFPSVVLSVLNAPYNGFGNLGTHQKI